eukprot:GHVS01009943.1.p1 GENE.GHVS01009943.1~~GHVS01009943.1.p1  ORF type:complete len:502 (+),score=140.12 GHVS01009943.1:49-1506(+)
MPHYYHRFSFSFFFFFALVVVPLLHEASFFSSFLVPSTGDTNNKHVVLLRALEVVAGDHLLIPLNDAVALPATPTLTQTTPTVPTAPTTAPSETETTLPSSSPQDQEEGCVVHRRVVVDGFHVLLHSSFSCRLAVVPPAPLEKNESYSCVVATEDMLGTALFVDPDELRGFVEEGENIRCLNSVLLNREHVDIEKPSYRAPPLTIYQYVPVIPPPPGTNSNNTNSTTPVEVNGSCALPLHSRYQPPCAGNCSGYRPIYMPLPNLFHNCTSSSSMEEEKEEASRLLLASPESTEAAAVGPPIKGIDIKGIGIKGIGTEGASGGRWQKLVVSADSTTEVVNKGRSSPQEVADLIVWKQMKQKRRKEDNQDAGGDKQDDRDDDELREMGEETDELISEQGRTIPSSVWKNMAVEVEEVGGCFDFKNPNKAGRREGGGIMCSGGLWYLPVGREQDMLFVCVVSIAVSFVATAVVICMSLMVWKPGFSSR